MRTMLVHAALVANGPRVAVTMDGEVIAHMSADYARSMAEAFLAVARWADEQATELALVERVGAVIQ